MPQSFTEEEFLKFLRSKIVKHGDQKELAKRIGICEQYMCEVIKGNKRLGDKPLSRMGFKRIVLYVKEK